MGEQTGETTKSATSVEAKAQSHNSFAWDALSNLLRDCHTELDGLLQKTKQIQEESSRNLYSFFEELLARLYRELERASAEFVNETRRRAQYEATAFLETFDVEANARMSARLDEALEKSQIAYERLASSLQERSEEYESSLKELSTATVQALEARGASLLEGFRAESQHVVDTLNANATNEAADRLRRTAGELADQHRKEAETDFEIFSNRLTTAGRALIEETEKQIAAHTQASLDVLRKQAFETVNRETSEFLLQNLRQRLDRLSSAIEQVNMGPTGSK